jgi:hypothetical protein
MCSRTGGVEENGDRLFLVGGRGQLVKRMKCTYLLGFEGGLVSGGELEWIREGEQLYSFTVSTRSDYHSSVQNNHTIPKRKLGLD